MKFLVILKKILKGQKLRTGPQWYVTTKNPLAGESRWVFEQKYRIFGNKTTNNVELAMQGLVTHFFSLKYLKPQKIYLH